MAIMRRKPWTTLLCVGVTLTFGIALLEGVGWIGLRLTGRAEDPRPVVALVGNDASWCRPTPRLGWEGIPHYIGSAFGTKVLLNQDGFRSEDLGAKRPGIFRVLYVGDSRTFGCEVPRDQSFPYQTERILSMEFGRKAVETYNAGVPGYTSLQGRRLLAPLCARLSPDAVVWTFGYNDRRLANLAPDSERMFLLVGTMGGLHQFLAPLVRRSSALALVFGRPHVTTARLLSGPPRVDLEAFAANRDAFVRFCLERGILPVVLVLRDNPALENRLTRAEDELAAGRPESAAALYRSGDDPAPMLLARRAGADRLRETGYPALADALLDEPLFDYSITHGGLPSEPDEPYRRASASPLEGVSFPIVRADRALDAETLFADFCHLTEEGNLRVGALIAEVLAPFVALASSAEGIDPAPVTDTAP